MTSARFRRNAVRNVSGFMAEHLETSTTVKKSKGPHDQQPRSTNRVTAWARTLRRWSEPAVTTSSMFRLAPFTSMRKQPVCLQWIRCCASKEFPDLQAHQTSLLQAETQARETQVAIVKTGDHRNRRQLHERLKGLDKARQKLVAKPVWLVTEIGDVDIDDNKIIRCRGAFHDEQDALDRKNLLRSGPDHTKWRLDYCVVCVDVNPTYPFYETSLEDDSLSSQPDRA